jgi:hypothetical protein
VDPITQQVKEEYDSLLMKLSDVDCAGHMSLFYAIQNQEENRFLLLARALILNKFYLKQKEDFTIYNSIV